MSSVLAGKDVMHRICTMRRLGWMNSSILVMMSKRGRRSDEVGVAVLQGRRRQMMMG